MSHVRFARHFERHVPCPADDVEAETVRAALDQYFARHPGVRGYVLDDQGAVRHHVAVFVNDEQIDDRRTLTDRVGARDTIHVLQALSGGCMPAGSVGQVGAVDDIDDAPTSARRERNERNERSAR